MYFVVFLIVYFTEITLKTYMFLIKQFSSKDLSIFYLKFTSL